MSAIINENQSFQDTGGQPLVGGFIYIGLQNLDPVLNPKPIFSDRALTVALANPQTLDSLGKSTNKIWTDGAYSMKIEDVNNVQIYEELDNGEASGIGVVGLTNVIGINAITANASPTITALRDGVIYELEIVSANTADAVTLNIDGLGAKTINRSFNQAVGIARFLVGQKVLVVYNLGNDNFELVNDNRSVILGVQGADIASAATVDLAAATGNRIDITGSVTIASFGTVLAGTLFELFCTGAPLLTNHATQLRCPGLVDLQLAIGSRVVLRSDGSGNFTVLSATGAYNIPQADGTVGQVLNTDGAGQLSWGGSGRIMQSVNVQDGAVATGTTVLPADDTIPQNTEGDEYMTLAITPTNASNILEITVVVNAVHSSGDWLAVVLFQDTTVDALACSAHPVSGHIGSSFIHRMAAGTVSATTFKVRIGAATAGTTTFNGVASARLYGGVLASSITIKEMLV